MLLFKGQYCLTQKFELNVTPAIVKSILDVVLSDDTIQQASPGYIDDI